MPHFIVEYSANLESDVAPRRLVDAVHKAVQASGVFELAAIRTRAERREVYDIADCDPRHAFVAVTGRIAPGRDAQTRQRVADMVLDALAHETAAAFETRGLALSVEISEIDNAAAARKNNLHARLATKVA